MIIFVIIFNILLSIINIYIFRKIVRLRKNLKTTTKILNKLEYDMNQFFNSSTSMDYDGAKRKS